MKLEDIKDPLFLKNLNNKELTSLSKDIREAIIDKVSKTGGHLSSNLGVIELTIALYKVFNNRDNYFLIINCRCWNRNLYLFKF